MVKSTKSTFLSIKIRVFSKGLPSTLGSISNSLPDKGGKDRLMVVLSIFNSFGPHRGIEIDEVEEK